MRKWHRWLVVFFGVFLLWIAVTGVLSQVVPWFVPKPDPAVAAAQVSAEGRHRQQRVPGIRGHCVYFKHVPHVLLP